MKSRPVGNALVVGGGVAGPVVAMALQRVGITATVHEARPAPAGDVGAWLGVQTNGLDALRAIDAEGPVLESGFPTPVIRFRSGTGKVLGSLPTDGTYPGALGGRSMRRSELYAAVHREALRRGIEIRYGSGLVDARHDDGPGDGVVAVFSDGTTETADLLVGADGVRSRVRSLLDPQHPGPRYVPVLNTAGYSDHVPDGVEVGELTMAFGRRAFFGYLVVPTGRTWWFANPPAPQEPRTGEIEELSDGQWRTMLHDYYGQDDSPAVDLVDATRDPLRGWTTYDVPKVRTWHDGRTVLIGDAAHATSPATGQGTSLAMEDAVVLAQCLRDLPRDAALERYTQLRRARVERIVADGYRTSKAKSPDAVGRTIRDLVMPLVLHRYASRGTGPQARARLHRIDWDATVAAAAHRPSRV